VPTGDLLAAQPARWDDKLAAIAEAQSAGRIVADLAPADVYALLISLAGTWSPVAATFTATAGDTAAEHDRRRVALRDVVRRALVPPS
jgi:Tetracyclin repressor-like, C-terminal domain